MSRSLAARITPPSSIGISYCFPVRLSVTVSVLFAMGLSFCRETSVRSAVLPDRPSKTRARINIYTVEQPPSQASTAAGGAPAFRGWRRRPLRGTLSDHESHLDLPIADRHNRIRHDST